MNYRDVLSYKYVFLPKKKLDEDIIDFNNLSIVKLGKVVDFQNLAALDAEVEFILGGELEDRLSYPSQSSPSRIAISYKEASMLLGQLDNSNNNPTSALLIMLNKLNSQGE